MREKYYSLVGYMLMVDIILLFVDQLERERACYLLVSFILLNTVFVAIDRLIQLANNKRLTWCNSEYHDRKELWAFKKFQYNQATTL